MKLTNWQLMNGQETLVKLSKMELPIKVSFPLLKNIKKVQELVELVEKTRHEIVAKYIVKDDAGNPIKDRDENGNEIENKVLINDPNAVNKELAELMSIENEVDIIQIPSNLDVNLSVAELVTIEWIFN